MADVMTLSELGENTRYYAANRGPYAAAKLSLADLATSAVHRLQPYLPALGTPVYEFEWDLLVVLDTCRVDALAAVADEYEFLPSEIRSVRSVGSKTSEWMKNTFTDRYAEEMADTAYVTFNAHSDDLLDPGEFAHLGEVWRSHWNAEMGGVPPRPVTDHAIAAGRELCPEYLVAHYKQPHQPYVHLEGLDPTNHREDATNDRGGVFGALIEGEFSREEIWQAYLDELRWALDDVGLLLENVDADRVAITADHGECFGEWGVYGHHGCVLIPELVEVPFVEGISARDSSDYDPGVSLAADHETEDVHEQLRALGYG
jgi:hypothetical protein